MGHVSFLFRHSAPSTCHELRGAFNCRSTQNPPPRSVDIDFPRSSVPLRFPTQATLWFADAYYSKPVDESDILAVARMTSFIKQVHTSVGRKPSVDRVTLVPRGFLSVSPCILVLTLYITRRMASYVCSFSGLDRLPSSQSMLICCWRIYSSRVFHALPRGNDERFYIGYCENGGCAPYICIYCSRFHGAFNYSAVRALPWAPCLLPYGNTSTWRQGDGSQPPFVASAGSSSTKAQAAASESILFYLALT